VPEVLWLNLRKLNLNLKRREMGTAL
jgi:hypothetical protein